MRLARYTLLLLALVGVFGLTGPAAALASNCQSAGDNQYIDPLNPCNNNGGGGGSSHSGGGGSSSSSSTSSSSSSSSSSGSATATLANSTTTNSTTTSSSSSKSDPSSKTLPYTGLDLGPALAVALALMGSGLVLRRLARGRVDAR